MSEKILKKNVILNHHDKENKKLGFWIYLMSDLVIFAILILTYIVINSHDNFSKKNLFNLSFVLVETLLLLFSSFIYSFVLIYMKRNNIKNTINCMICTCILGFIFVLMEIYEFYHFINHGYNPQKDAFFSSFFTLIGTHGIHVISGIVWILILIFQVFFIGLNKLICIRIYCLGIFWHFLDIIWIIIFSVVYLLGSI